MEGLYMDKHKCLVVVMPVRCDDNSRTVEWRAHGVYPSLDRTNGEDWIRRIHRTDEKGSLIMDVVTSFQEKQEGGEMILGEFSDEKGIVCWEDDYHETWMRIFVVQEQFMYFRRTPLFSLFLLHVMAKLVKDCFICASFMVSSARMFFAQILLDTF